MQQLVKDLMTSDPRTVSGGAPLSDAARIMGEADVGSVLVLKEDQSLCGIVTDRDIVIRAVAQGRHPKTATVEEFCSHEVTAVSPGDRAEEAERIMREKGVRRLAVVDGGRPMGVISLDDLAVARHPGSALAEITVKARHTATKATQAARAKLAARKASRTGDAKPDPDVGRSRAKPDPDVGPSSA